MNAGISGSDIRDLMLEAVEKRFGSLRAPEPIEMLTDNGAPYTAKDTITFAHQLNLKSCFTPVRSPQSNGMSEAFVKTFKRDYVGVNPLPSAKIVLELLADWLIDYNDNHPHSGLKMRSPREFRSANYMTMTFDFLAQQTFHSRVYQKAFSLFDSIGNFIINPPF